MKTTKTKEQFIELRAKGFSYDKIAETLNVSKRTLITWSKEFTIEIENFRTIELDALQRKFFATLESKIENLGIILEKIKGELEKRSFDDTPTEKLLEMMLKYSNELKKEEQELFFTGDKEPMDLDLDFLVNPKWKA